MRRFLATLAPLLIASALAGCGGSDEPLTQDNFAERILAASADAGSGHMELSVEAQGQSFAGDGDFVVGDADGDGSASHLTIEVAGQPIEVIVVDRSIYLNMGEVTRSKFLELDSDVSSGPLAPLAEMAESLLENASPTAALEAYEAAATSFTQEGDTETIDGVETTPYVIELDTEKFLDSMGMELPAGTDTSAMVFDVTLYVGDDDLIYKSVADSAGATATVQITDWGQDVEIDAPAQDEITTADELG